MSTSIKISQLNNFSNVVVAEDFIPMVDSSSLTTYRVSVTTFSDWFSKSGSVLSASWASHSLISVSSSWASSSFSSSTAHSLIWPNTASSSFAQNAWSASWAERSGVSLNSLATSGTASYALSAKSSSYAGTSSVALTASYFNFTIPDVGEPPTASYARRAGTASYAHFATSASRAISSSNADTASYYSGGSALTYFETYNFDLINNVESWLSVPHSWPGYTPKFVRCVLKCVSNDAGTGYQVDDEIDAACWTDADKQAITYGANNTYVFARLTAIGIGQFFCVNKNSFNRANPTSIANFKMKMYAAL